MTTFIVFAEHLYKASAPGAESERTMFFYDKARVDGLRRRNETPTYMEEHFVDRHDFLFFRAVEFAKRPKKFGPADATTANARPILVGNVYTHAYCSVRL